MTETQEEFGQSVVTPSGVEVYYQPKPKRLYKVRSTWPYDSDDKREWREVPSVTNVLGVLDKPALVWWGMKVGVEGVLQLHQLRLIEQYGDDCYPPSMVLRDEEGSWSVADADKVIDLLTKQKLTVNHQRDKAADRGQAVHDAFEEWAKTGVLPDATIFPPEQQGYVHGLTQFLIDAKPEPIASEVMVGSVQHGYAGRYDIRLRIPEECAVVYHRTPVRGPKYAALPPGLLLADLKTSKGVYASHHLQLAAYEGASVECGYEPTDAQGVLHVSSDGNYEFVRSKGRLEHFLAVKAVMDALEEIKKAA